MQEYQVSLPHYLGVLVDYKKQNLVKFYFIFFKSCEHTVCARWLRLVEMILKPCCWKIWLSLTKMLTQQQNSHETPLAYLSMHSSTWINHHSGTSEKLNFISFLVLCHYESFVNLNPPTYIIIFSFKVDSRHQRDNIGFEVPWDWITV